MLKGVNLDIPAGRFPGADGAVGFGQDDAAQPDRRPRQPVERRGRGRRAPTSPALSGGELARWRADNIGFVFQLYNLLPVLTAERNVELPLLLTNLSQAERRKRVGIALKVVGLADRAKHYPRQLSGGQEQRVGIARAIVTDPTLLLCDEPTGDLDRKSGDEILDLLQALNQRARQDHRHGDARPARRRARDADAASRQGRAAWRRYAMKFLPLLWSSLWRKKLRTIFTLLSIFVAFLLFGLLMTIRTAFSFGVDIAGLDRLVLIHKVSLIMPLPVSYLERLQATDGVDAGHAQHVVRRHLPGPVELLRADRRRARSRSSKIYPEFKLPPEQIDGLAGRPAGRGGRRRPGHAASAGRSAIAFRSRARSGSRSRARSGSSTSSASTTATRASTRRSSSSATTTWTRTGGRAKGMVGWYIVKIADPSQAQAMGAKFDDMFANSSAETKTTTEKGFVEGFAKQVGDIGAIMIAIVAAVLFTMLLVAANTMAQSVRERTSEVGVLKTLGFSNAAILSLVLGESVLIAAPGRRPRAAGRLAVRPAAATRPAACCPSSSCRRAMSPSARR